MTITNEGTATPRHRQAVQEAGSGNGGAGIAAVGGVLGALAASACCILPLVLFGVGIGGVWIGNLTALAPYQPIFVAFTVVVLVWGFWRVYRPQRACAEGETCARPLPNRVVKAGLWLATALIGAALAFPYLASLFLPT
jgi:mercuric ion transport protein